MRITSIWLIIVWLFINPWIAANADNSGAKQNNSCYQPSGEEMALDGLIARPLMLGATAVGTGIFLVTLPFSLIGGNVDEAGERLVAEPARTTFGSCLGCVPYNIGSKSQECN